MKYRDIIYGNYHSTQVNKDQVDHRVLLEQQSYYYGKELVPYLPANKEARIVDLGCGFGSFVHAAKQAGYSRVSGFDLSTEQVEVAHQLGISEVQEASIEWYFSSSNQADCIVGVDIIEHLTKDELVTFLQACYEHLPSGGSVVFRTPNMDAPLASIYAFADLSHETYLNKSSSLQVLKSCGFDKVEVLPSMILNRNPAKELLRRSIWWCSKTWLKVLLFASGRTWNEVVFTPNLIIRAFKA